MSGEPLKRRDFLKTVAAGTAAMAGVRMVRGKSSPETDREQPSPLGDGH